MLLGMFFFIALIGILMGVRDIWAFHSFDYHCNQLAYWTDEIFCMKPDGKYQWFLPKTD